MRAQPLKRGCAGHGKDRIRAHATTDDVPTPDDVRTRIGPFSCPHASVSHIRARKRLFSFPTWFNSQLGHGYGRFCAQSLHSATFGHGYGLFCARPEGWPTPTSLRSSLPTSPSWSFDHSYPSGPSHSRCRGRHGRADHPSGLRDMAGTLEAARLDAAKPQSGSNRERKAVEPAWRLSRLRFGVSLGYLS